MDAATINTKFPALARVMKAATAAKGPAAALPQDVVTMSRPVHVTTPPAALSRSTGSSAGRVAAGVTGAAIGGAGLGYLGLYVGANLGLHIGLSQPAGSGAVGLIGWFFNALHAAAVGELIGGAAYLAVGLAAGGAAGVAIYNALHKK